MKAGMAQRFAQFVLAFSFLGFNAATAEDRMQVNYLLIEIRGKSVETLKFAFDESGCRMSYLREEKRFKWSVTEPAATQLRDFLADFNASDAGDLASSDTPFPLIYELRGTDIQPPFTVGKAGRSKLAVLLFTSDVERNDVSTSGALVKNSLLYDLIWESDRK